MHIFQSSAEQHFIGWSVGGKEQHIDPSAEESITHISQVTTVIAIAAIFILYLDGQNRPAMCGEQRNQPRNQLIVIPVHLA
ncbi:hypothetical protein D3C71_1960290 [compost metagenome]